MGKWKKYDSKPIVREAIQVTRENPVYGALNSTTGTIWVGEDLVNFKHYEEVKEGDYIVRLSVDNTYHCSKEVFEERNVVATDELEIPVEPIMKFFAYKHLPEKLQKVSKPFCLLAQDMIRTLPQNAERSTCLRKILEAKDCAVRATL